VSGLVRASDGDRERAVTSLREHLVQGRLSLEDFTLRMSAAYEAATSADLAELEHDLPAAVTPERGRRSVGFLLSIFGSTARAGSFRVRKHVVCVAIFGAVALDLRGALLEDDVVDVHSITIFGGLDVVVPEGVEVDLTGLALFGAKETKGTRGIPPPGAPLVRVKALVMFGGATVKVKPS
jgi:DUF1707 SHOCT-like domain